MHLNSKLSMKTFLKLLLDLGQNQHVFIKIKQGGITSSRYLLWLIFINLTLVQEFSMDFLKFTKREALWGPSFLQLEHPVTNCPNLLKNFLLLSIPMNSLLRTASHSSIKFVPSPSIKIIPWRVLTWNPSSPTFPSPKRSTLLVIPFLILTDNFTLSSLEIISNNFWNWLAKELSFSSITNCSHKKTVSPWEAH